MKKNPAAYEPGADFAWHSPKNDPPTDGVEYHVTTLTGHQGRGFYRTFSRSFINRRRIIYRIEEVARYRRL